jgi:hypothetical protein
MQQQWLRLHWLLPLQQPQEVAWVGAAAPAGTGGHRLA